jgi:hypothetical protein
MDTTAGNPTRGGSTPSDGAAPSHGHSKLGIFSDFESFAAGAVAGLVAETLMHPLDTASHRAKVHPGAEYGSIFGAFRRLYSQEGLRAFYAGISATMVASPPNSAVYFSTYEICKQAGLSLTGNQLIMSRNCENSRSLTLNAPSPSHLFFADGAHSSAVFFVSGALSELTSSLITLPLEVAKSRLQVGN